MNSHAQIHFQTPPAMERHCSRCPRSLGPLDRKKGNGGWFTACSRCREIRREKGRSRQAISSPGPIQQLDADTDKENANPCVDSRTRDIPQPVISRRLGRPRRPFEQVQDRVCNRCPLTLGPMDRKSNGGWFTACFRCREVDRERQYAISTRHGYRNNANPCVDLSTPNGHGPGKRPLEEPEVSTPPCRRPRLPEPEASTNPLSRPQEGNEQEPREEDEHQRLQHIDEGDDRSPHRPRLPEPEILTLPLGRPQEGNEQQEGEDNDEYSDDDDYDAIFRQMAEGLI
jgi:hypothetical protein